MLSAKEVFIQPNSIMAQPNYKLTSNELASTRKNTIWINDVPWWKNLGVLSPLPLPHRIDAVDRMKVRSAMKETGALIARWADNWNSEPTEWWYVCCDDPEYSVESIQSSRGRRDVRKGLRECTVKMIEANPFIDQVYQLYKDSIISFGYQPQDKDGFRKRIQKAAEYSGSHFWVTFVNEKLVSFATAQLFDNAVTTGFSMSDPEYRKHCPNNALFYEMAHYYMRRGDVRFITNGARTLRHPTTINDMLERMGYRKVYCRLNVELSPLATAIFRSRISKWGKWIGLPAILKNKWINITGLDTLKGITDSFL